MAKGNKATGTGFVPKMVTASSMEEILKIRDDGVQAYKNIIQDAIAPIPACDIMLLNQALLEVTQTVTTNAAESIG